MYKHFLAIPIDLQTLVRQLGHGILSSPPREKRNDGHSSSHPCTLANQQSLHWERPFKFRSPNPYGKTCPLLSRCSCPRRAMSQEARESRKGTASLSRTCTNSVSGISESSSATDRNLLPSGQGLRCSGSQVICNDPILRSPFPPPTSNSPLSLIPRGQPPPGHRPSNTLMI